MAEPPKRYSGPYAHKTKEYFEEGREKTLTEDRCVVAPSGIGTVVFAHKLTAVGKLSYRRWLTLRGLLPVAGRLILSVFPA